MHKAAMEMGKWALEWAKATGYDNITAQGWDNLKDCMEAVKEAICADKEYREIEEMDEYGDMEKFEKMLSMGNDRMGYDRWRYANGRFAPKGRGHRSGYSPLVHMPYLEEDMYDYDLMGMPPEIYGNYRMGYSKDGARNGERKDGMMQGEHDGSRYGRSYDNYRAAKRHYTESRDPEEQRKMKEHIDEIFDDMGDITNDIAKDLTAEERQKYKQRLQAMMQKMQ